MTGIKIILKKIATGAVLPSLLFAAVSSPIRCNLSRDGGVFKSNDRGINWTQKVATPVKNSTIGSLNILTMAISSFNPNIIYIGSDGSGIYKSTDSGDTWNQLVDKNNALDKGATVFDIEINPINPDFVYAAVFQNSAGRILLSRDAGQSWQEIFVASNSGTKITNLMIDNSNSAIIYAGLSDGNIIKSQDAGLSWRSIKSFASKISDIKIDPRNSQIIYLANFSGDIYKSSDSGQDWETLSRKTVNYYAGGNSVSSIEIDAADSGVIYAATESGLLVSHDQGQTWLILNNLITPNSSIAGSIAQDKNSPNIIYYAFGSIIYKTVNYGASWSVVQIQTSRQIGIIKIDPTDSSIIYLGIHN